VTGTAQARTRHQRVLAYTGRMIDLRDAHRTLAPEDGCAACSAGPGEWCDPWCPGTGDDA